MLLTRFVTKSMVTFFSKTKVTVFKNANRRRRSVAIPLRAGWALEVFLLGNEWLGWILTGPTLVFAGQEAAEHMCLHALGIASVREVLLHKVWGMNGIEPSSQMLQWLPAKQGMFSSQQSCCSVWLPFKSLSETAS